MEAIKAKIMRLRGEIERDHDDVPRQMAYMLLFDGYLRAWEGLPERHRPERPPIWEAGSSIKFGSNIRRHGRGGGSDGLSKTLTCWRAIRRPRNKVTRSAICLSCG
ncbi:hypothetical protein [Sphingomonas nostoxanthinifaciens]|uniref:hypothetical protein n=1 Tax=Sphingomonas nostoxanthinifaciens TaxID=2872652 RepID=UPI001CC1CF67|nr:hypothetical protein [Sphingomonas nostoxanthinifaciens]UAK25503.1 hypothetical protein K8P63_04880 [Sphingomonas nostoxanthinifaciens]